MLSFAIDIAIDIAIERCCGTLVSSAKLVEVEVDSCQDLLLKGGCDNRNLMGVVSRDNSERPLMLPGTCDR